MSRTLKRLMLSVVIAGGSALRTEAKAASAGRGDVRITARSEFEIQTSPVIAGAFSLRDTAARSRPPGFVAPASTRLLGGARSS